MRKNLTISGAWFIQLFCLKYVAHMHLHWFWVWLPLILVPIEAIAVMYLNKYWLRILAWYDFKCMQLDNRIRLWSGKRSMHKAIKKGNKFKS